MKKIDIIKKFYLNLFVFNNRMYNFILCNSLGRIVYSCYILINFRNLRIIFFFM